MVRHCGGIDPGTPLLFTPISTGKHNASYWVDGLPDRLVLRIAPPDAVGFLFYERLMMRQEPALHALIRAQTSLPVAAIAGHDFGRELVPLDYLLMEALPGTPMSDAPWLTGAHRRRALRQVGWYLRELHALTASDCLGVAQYGYLGAHRPMQAQSTWAEAFGVMWNLLLDDVVACGAYRPSEGDLMRALFERFRGHFEHPVTSRLLHMDVWSQNVLVDRNGDVTGLVDFDRALWGDVEIEFAVLDYCGFSEPAFWEGYGVPRDESPEAALRRTFYLLYEIQKYMPIEVWRRNNRRAALRYRDRSLALAADLL
jgi:fructosamine-3-kinase